MESNYGDSSGPPDSLTASLTAVMVALIEDCRSFGCSAAADRNMDWSHFR
jgi:hypothetical protein